MRKPVVTGGLMVSALFSGAWTGPWEGGSRPMAAAFRSLAEQGNPKAQSVLGKVWRKG